MNHMLNALRAAWLRYPLLLLMVCVLSYGLLVPWLGFYWDDLPMGWIPYQLGPSGTARYFSTNRPVWGWLYQITTPVLGMVPWAWQIFAIFWRWMSALVFWRVLKRIWPDRIWIAETAGLFIVLFPAFRQQYAALLYSHFFIVLTSFIFSFDCMLAAMAQPGKKMLFTGAGVLFSSVNLFMLEYFFTLEIIRPFLIWGIVRREYSGYRNVLRLVFREWVPYLIILMLAALWRGIFYPYQTEYYQFNLMDKIRERPFAGLVGLANQIADSLYVILVQSWGSILSLDFISDSGLRILVINSFAVLGIAGLIAGYYLLKKPLAPVSLTNRTAFGLGLMSCGLLVFLLAGWPVWLVGRQVLLDFPEDRFSLPFIFGFSLFFTGLLELVPRGYGLRLMVIAACMGLLGSYQYRLAEDYVLDWDHQKRFFWQLSWRVPDLKPGTILLVNQLPLQYYSDNSLAAPLNWQYAPHNRSDKLDYMLYYPELRAGGGKLTSIQPDVSINHDYLGAIFVGNTSNSVAIYHTLRSCLRVLEPYPDSNHPLLPAIMKKAASFSSVERINVNGNSQLPMPLYGPEPEHEWCYYFEMADLARQKADWSGAAALGAEALSSNLSPKDGSESYIFILSHLNLRDYDKALEWTRRGVDLNAELIPFFCQIWQDQVGNLDDKEAASAWQKARDSFSCESISE